MAIGIVICMLTCSHNYMCFEWLGVVYHFVVLPFGCAPACWVFTKLMKTMVKYWRSRGIKCLQYIDDLFAGDQPKSKAAVAQRVMIDTLVDCGWQINWAKSDLVLSHEKEFIGFRIDLVHGGQGRIRLSESC